jgi:hypothetical protein
MLVIEVSSSFVIPGLAHMPSNIRVQASTVLGSLFLIVRIVSGVADCKSKEGSKYADLVAGPARGGTPIYAKPAFTPTNFIV